MGMKEKIVKQRLDCGCWSMSKGESSKGEMGDRCYGRKSARFLWLMRIWVFILSGKPLEAFEPSGNKFVLHLNTITLTAVWRVGWVEGQRSRWRDQLEGKCKNLGEEQVAGLERWGGYQ